MLRSIFLFLVLPGGFILPIFALEHTLDYSDTPVMLSLSLGVMAGSFALFGRGIYLPERRLVMPLLVFIAFHAASCLWARNPSESWASSLKLISLFGLTSLIVTHLKEEGFRMALFKSLSLTAILAIFIGCYQIFRQGDNLAIDLHQVHSVFGHKNQFSFFLLLSSILAVYGHSVFKKSHISRFWLWINKSGVVLSVILIIFLDTRSVQIATIVSVLLLLFSKPLADSLSRKQLLAARTLVVLCIVTVSTLRGVNLSSSSLHERTLLWRNTLDLIESNPIMGIGGGNWQFEYLQFGISEITTASQHQITFQNPHNDFLWILSEVGFVGILPLIWIIIFIVARTHKTWQYKATRKPLLISAVALMSWGLFSMFSFPIDRPLHLILLSIVLAIWLESTGSIANPARPKKGITGAVFLMGIIIVLTNGFRFYGEMNTREILRLKDQRVFAQIPYLAEKAESIFYRVDPMSTPIASYAGLYWFTQLEALKQQEQYAEHAFRISPYDPEILTNYGVMKMRHLQPNTARESFEDALRINRHYQPAQMNLKLLQEIQNGVQ